MSSLHTPNLDSLSEVDLYWAGYIRADGCIPYDNRTVSFSQVIREPVAGFCLYAGLPESRTKTYQATSQSTGRTYTYHVVNVLHLVKPYKSLGVKADFAREDLYDSLDFWRGLIDGDGWVHLYPNGVGVTLGFCGSLHDVEMFCKLVTRLVGRKGVKPSRHGSIWMSHVGGDYGKDLIGMMYADKFSANPLKSQKALTAAGRRRTGIRKY